MMLLNVGGPTSTIQLIVCVIPIDTLDGSDRLDEWLCCAVLRWFGNTTAGLARSAGLVGGASRLDQPVKSIDFTIFIC
jgi:hypothetical protein